MKFGSVCSGIEAASVAWSVLGWKAAWFSEIEPFACAVLAHHYPDVPNLGDMTALPARIRAGEIEAPDILCGGTPCQAFSVAGLRKSLADARGNLSLTFCEIANEIDTRRAADGRDPAIVFWENVPGVLSTKDNAFGCFLAGLAGEDGALEPPGGKWADAGCVFGPQRTVAWRVLDAQYFGLAQRRRRVFVVASARNGFDPTAVLFEFGGVRRDSAPSREAGKGFAADLAPSLTASGRGVERTGETRGQDPVIAQCLTTGTGQRYDPETETILPVAFNARQDPVSGNVSGALDTSSPQAQAVAHRYVMPTMVSGGSTDASHNQMSGQFREEYIVPQGMAVRRLTPRECERLQGFPDDYTLIPYSRAVRIEKLEQDWIKYLMRGGVMTFEQVCRAAADGPRYKALGNSWAVPCVRWIGRRIAAALSKMANDKPDTVDIFS